MDVKSLDLETNMIYPTLGRRGPKIIFVCHFQFILILGGLVGPELWYKMLVSYNMVFGYWDVVHRHTLLKDEKSMALTAPAYSTVQIAPNYSPFLM